MSCFQYLYLLQVKGIDSTYYVCYEQSSLETSLETGRRLRRTTETVPKQLADNRQFSTNGSPRDLGTISSVAFFLFNSIMLNIMQLASVIYLVAYMMSVWSLLQPQTQEICLFFHLTKIICVALKSSKQRNNFDACICLSVSLASNKYNFDTCCVGVLLNYLPSCSVLNMRK